MTTTPSTVPDELLDEARYLALLERLAVVHRSRMLELVEVDERYELLWFVLFGSPEFDRLARERSRALTHGGASPVDGDQPAAAATARRRRPRSTGSTRGLGLRRQH